MKKLLILLSFLTLLTSCFGGDEVQTGLITQEKEGFSVGVPSSWVDFSNDSRTIPTVKGSNIELAFSSPDINNGYSNSFTILSQDLEKDMTSKDFSILNNIIVSKEALNYTKLESKDITFADQDISTLYVYEAKYNSKTPSVKFVQVGKVCEKNKAFFLTIGVNMDIKSTSKYEDILKTFTCK